MTQVLLDTGIIYAIFDRRDAWHTAATTLVADQVLEVHLTVTGLPEVAYLLETRFGDPLSHHLVDWVSQRHASLEQMLPQDLRRMASLMSTYPAVGFVDASIVAIAERLFIDTIATTDRRHFAAIRPAHIERFALVP